MKFATCLLAVLAVTNAKVVSRKSFNDNFHDFMDVIAQEAGETLFAIMSEYETEEEFQKSQNYLMGQNFVQILGEMEHLEEFVAVVDFLEEDNISIHYYLDLLHEALGIETEKSRQLVRHSGSSFNDFLRDVIDNLPKASLSALYDQKITEDEEFNASMTKLRSDEFKALWNALWANEVFQAEVQTLAENGISVELMVEEVLALFGQ